MTFLVEGRDIDIIFWGNRGYGWYIGKRVSERVEDRFNISS
jgi:hypothetical protein